MGHTSSSPDPETLLNGLFARVAAVQPPTSGNEWHMAIGALLALGTVGALDDDQRQRWDERAQSEARRLELTP